MFSDSNKNLIRTCFVISILLVSNGVGPEFFFDSVPTIPLLLVSNNEKNSFTVVVLVHFVRVHHIYCRSKSYMFKFLRKFVFNMVSKLYLVEGQVFKPCYDLAMHVYLPILLNPLASPKMEVTNEGGCKSA